MTCWTEVPSLGNINRYINEIQKFPLLTAEEELATQHEGELGKTKLILSHLRLAASIAREYLPSGHDYADLVQEANMGLVRATKHFDPSRARFSTFAMMYIRAELNEFNVRYLRQVRVATTKPQRKLLFNLGGMHTDKLMLTGAKRFSPEDIEHIAAMLDVKVEEVNEMERRMAGGESSFDPLTSDEDVGLNHFIAVPDADPVAVLEKCEIDWVSTNGVKEALVHLNEREQFIIHHRYMVEEEEKLNLADLAKIFAVSFQRIQQIENRALKKLREHLAAYDDAKIAEAPSKKIEVKEEAPPMDFHTAKALRVRHLNGKFVEKHLLKQAMELIETEYA